MYGDEEKVNRRFLQIEVEDEEDEGRLLLGLEHDVPSEEKNRSYERAMMKDPVVRFTKMMGSSPRRWWDCLALIVLIMINICVIIVRPHDKAVRTVEFGTIDDDQCVEQVTTDQLFDRFGISGEWETDRDGWNMLEVMWKYHNDGEPVPIDGYPYLFVGSVGPAYNKEALIRNGITHIVDATNSIPNKYPDDFQYHNIRVRDREDEDNDISVYWEDSNKFIENARQNGGKVLVHCYQGKIRSVSTVAAYLIKGHGLGVEKAIDLIRTTRPIAEPNEEYWKRLYELENDDD